MTILIVFGALVSMIYATSYGGSVLGYVDTFINQIALLLGVIFECIIFAWIFGAERLVGFLNARSKTIKLGKWWLLIVKFVLPIFIAVVWIGGMADVIKTSTFDQLIFTFIVAAILIVSTAIFTLLPAKDPDWDNVEERV